LLQAEVDFSKLIRVWDRSGGVSESFQAFCTSDSERYWSLGGFALNEGRAKYTAPAESVTTFYGSMPVQAVEEGP
jgi:hypothetical protein